MFDRVSDGIREDGTIPPATLRQLTALLYGGVQGVKLPKGPVGKPTIDGTAVVEALGVAWPSFTTAQKRALERALNRRGKPRKPKAAPADVPRLPSANTCKTAADGYALNSALTADALALRDAIAANIPGYGTPAWTVCVYDWGDVGGTALADTIQWRLSADSTPWKQDMWDTIAFFTGTLDMCFVRVFPDWFTISAGNQRTLMGHEMYHCLHKEWGKGSTSERNPLWAEESLATWAGHQVAPATYAPIDKAPGLYYDHWNNHWAKKLFARTYDGLGFIGRVEQMSGTSGVWGRVTSVWGAKEDSPAIFSSLTGSNQPDVLNTWGSGLYRQPSFPSGWHQTVPWDVPDPYGPEYFKMTIPLGAATERLETKDYRPDLYVVRSDERPLVNVTVEGFGRVTDGKTDWPHPSGQWFCFGGKCECPEGQHEKAAIPAHADIGDKLYAGLAAAGGVSALVLEPHAMSEYCEDDEEPQQPPAGGGDGAPGGGSNGDPHLTTNDGVRYDFQAAGEFVLARGPGLEVQARQEPWEKSKYASINTQFAFRVGTARVTVAAGGTMEVRVGGALRRPDRAPVGLPGGGSIRAATLDDRCSGLVLTWPDGSRACVWSVGVWGVALSLQPSAAVRGKLVGLLGNADGNGANDFVTRDGKQLDAAALRKSSTAAFQQLYRVFGQSWRLKQAESLLRYAKGETTATFTKLKFPSRFWTVDNISAAARARAEAKCRELGVTDPEVLEDCILDLAVTGEEAFAEAAAVEEDVAFPETPWTVVNGLEHVVWGPVSLAPTADGTLHLGAATAPANNWINPGQYVVAHLGADGAQAPLTVLAPVVRVDPPLLVAGAAGLALFGYVDGWPATPPPGTSTRGVMRWPVAPAGPVADQVPFIAGDPVTYAETPDGTPWIVTQSAGGGHHTLWRGAGATATPHEIVAGPGCYDVDVKLGIEGANPWLAWHEWDCADDATDYGWHLAQVDAATGTIGPDVRMPVPPGSGLPLYDGLGRPAAMVVRPGSAGAWLAYTLRVGETTDRRGTPHAFLWSTATGTATDLGVVPDVDATLQLAATPSGALWVGWFDATRRSNRQLVRFRRIAPGTTTFEPTTYTVTWPSRGTDSPFRSQIEVATRGERLDVVVYDRADSSGDGIVWHTRVG